MDRKVILVFVSAVLLLLSTAFTLILNDTGQVFYTGSPFDGSTCAQCHSGGATTPTVAVTANPAFGVGNTYTPSTTYTINTTVSGSYSKFGFDMEIIDSNSPSAAADAGTFGAMLSGNCQKFVFAGNPTNITHTTPSGTAGSATFSFVWTAPASGSVFIYCSGLGVNLNANTTGDKVGTFSLSLTPTGIGVEEPGAGKIHLSVFPNPASDRLNISYYLEARTHVSVGIFNLSGEKVAELFDETQMPGPHAKEAVLPVGMSRGAYMLKLKVDGHEMAQKLMVL